MAISLEVNEEAISVEMSQRMGQLTIKVKSHPAFEELVKGWGDGSERSVTSYGRLWVPVGGDEAVEPLKVYHGGSALPNYPEFALNQCGDSIEAMGMFNFSFCRLVGTSRPEGVTFRILEGPMSHEKLRTLFKSLQVAQKRVCHDFLVPVTFTLRTSIAERH